MVDYSLANKSQVQLLDQINSFANQQFPALKAEKLGRMLLRQKLLSPKQLQKALGEHNRSVRKLGEVLVKNHLITPRQLKTTLANQKVKLGSILKKKGLLSPSDLEKSLSRQFTSNKKLGQLLLEEQKISASDLDSALKEQHWRRQGFWVID